MIQFHHVTKSYPGHDAAITDINLTIGAGEFVFLIGPSGAGKTTILKLLRRDTLPTSGSIKVDDWDLTKLPKKNIYKLRQKVGMVFQDFKLLTDRTVFENVAIGLEILGKKRREINKGVADVLDLVGLAKKRNLFPQQLSAGEMQRTSIARAIVAGPRVLLADEPTGNLDPDTSWEILDILTEINRIGTTVVMTTHNTMLVNHIKTRTILLKEGKIVKDMEKGEYHTESGNRNRIIKNL